MFTHPRVLALRNCGFLFTLVLILSLSGCSGLKPAPTATPYPTYTPVPSLPTYTPYPTLTPAPTFTSYPSPTPYPTYTPYPTPTPVPLAGKGQWVHGHFWSIKVVDVRSVAELDGIRPTEDQFIVVEVDWKAAGTEEMHPIHGIDFELVDPDGAVYDIAGMIYRSGNTEEPQGPGEKFNKDSYRTVRASGAASGTFKLVFDVPAQAKGLKLWFQDFPLIDLGLN